MDILTAAEQIAAMSTATISDALFRMGYKDRTMRSRIKPIAPQMRVAGPAFTAQAYPGGTHACGKALDSIEAGQVLVIDGQGYLEAVLWGEIFSTMAMAKGVLGTIVDGAVRDINEIIKLGYPVFAAGITPAAGTGDRLGQVDLPIQCGGVVVNPGDWVFGDVLGVVVVRPEMLVETCDWCHEVLIKEQKMKEGIRSDAGEQ
jgi:regulator of RNase E activity RraA